VRVRRRSLEDRNRRKADTDRPATNDCNGSIAVVGLSPLNVVNQPEAVARKSSRDNHKKGS
jgi:hypothetical protein